MAKKRDYRQEYRAYQGKPEQIKRRAERVKTRRKLEKMGLVHKGDGKDIDHINHRTSDMSMDNLEIETPSKNRSFPRTRTGRVKT